MESDSDISEVLKLDREGRLHAILPNLIRVKIQKAMEEIQQADVARLELDEYLVCRFIST